MPVPLDIIKKFQYWTVRDLSIFDTNFQENPDTNAGCIVEMLLTMHKRHTYTNYQTEDTKYRNLRDFKGKSYDTLRKFICIDMNDTGSLCFVSQMTRLCLLNIVYAIQIKHMNFDHCFLVVGFTDDQEFLLVTRDYNNISDIWIRISREDMEKSKNTILILVNDIPKLKPGRIPSPAFPITGPFKPSPAFDNDTPSSKCGMLKNESKK